MHLQLQALLALLEMGYARSERNLDSPKCHSKTVRHQVGHAAQWTGITKDFKKVKTTLGFFFKQNIPE